METVQLIRHLQKVRLLVTPEKLIELMHPHTSYEHERRYV